MSIIRRALGGQQNEQRLFALSSKLPLPGEMMPGDAGIPVTETTAQALTAVWASTRLIADTIASLPVGVFERQGAVRIAAERPEWLDSPDLSNPNASGFQLWQSVTQSLLYHGNSYSMIVRGNDGRVIEVLPLDPTRVTPERVKIDGMSRIVYKIKTDNDTVVAPSEDIIHIPLFVKPGRIAGVSPIDACRTALSSAIVAEAFGAKWFRNSGVPSGVIEVPNELTGEQAQDLISAWRRTHGGMNGANVPGILSGGAAFKPISVNPADVLWIEARQFGVEEVARIYRVPPFMIGVNTAGAVSYSSVEQAMMFFVQHTIRPYLEQIEAAYGRLFPVSRTGAQVFMKFAVDGLLRGDVKTRYEAYASGITNGFMTVADARALEDLPPLDDTTRQPLRALNLAPAATADKRAQADIYAILIKAGLDPAEAARLAGLGA